VLSTLPLIITKDYRMAVNHASGVTSVTMICHTLHVINLIVTQYQLLDGWWGWRVLFDTGHIWASLSPHGIFK